MKKSIVFVIVLGLLSVTGLVTAQTNGWIGTGWITQGSLIPAVSLKSNLDYLEAQKVVKPQDCTGDEKRVTWNNGSWECQNVLVTTPVASSCTFNGVTVADGRSVAAYNTQSVAFGETCGQQIRNCSNGTLSGSYQFSSCSARQANSCIFNGVAVADGQTVTAHETSSVDAPQSCNTQTRTCNNGTLSGSFTNSVCTVQASACTSQDLSFVYTINIGNGANRKGTSCVVPARLVPNSQVGFTDTYTYPTECQGTGSTYRESQGSGNYIHRATCGTSGWELSTQELNVQTCPDDGKVIDTYELAEYAVRYQVDSRCSCGVAVTGGEYGKDLVCRGSNLPPQ